MTKRAQLEKWARVSLGAVCLLLLINLVSQFGGIRVGASRTSMPPPGNSDKRLKPNSAGFDELARYDTNVHLELLKEFRSRPVPQFGRNPFEIPAARSAPAPVSTAPVTAPQPTPPPPPPPIALKALGYTEMAGKQEAIVSDDEQTYVVHEGDTVAQKYRVLKITPKFVEVEDVSSHQTAQLPFAP